MKRISEILKTDYLSHCLSCGWTYMDMGVHTHPELIPCEKCKSPLNLESEEEFEVEYEEVSCQEFEV